MPMPAEARRSGLTSMRTAYFCEPYTLTCATPSTIDRRWASCVSAYSSICDNGSVEEVIARYKIGASAGFTLRKVGGVGMSVGNWRCAAEIADCTSCAAPSMLRSSSKVSVIDVVPSALVEFIELMPAMVDSCASSGVATAEAMVSGDAPGRLAEMLMVGKSTLGSSLTGRRGYAATPNTTNAAISSVVMTGRRIQSSGRFIASAVLGDLHRGAVHQQHLAVDHHCLAYAHALVDHGMLAADRAGGDIALLHFVIRADNEDETALR